MKPAHPTPGDPPQPRPDPDPKPAARTVEELTALNVASIVHLEKATHADRNLPERLSDRIAGFCGSITFVWVHVLWFAGWVCWNSIPGTRHFDAFPFTLLTLLVSLEAIFLSAFILISQNHAGRLTDRRNHLDLQINLLSEQENTKMLRMLHLIAARLGANVDEDPSIRVLEQATRPQKLAQQIDTAEAKVQQEKAPDGLTQKGN